MRLPGQRPDQAGPRTPCLRRDDPPTQVLTLSLLDEVGEPRPSWGATACNPRKGNSHTWEDVQSELCDVILTAMVALRTITPDAGKVFAERLEHVADRSLTG
ncbi:MazG-like family protein [Streptomyces sannanensis]|uniref:MazG-like family protein n=1 Tax=Streptomyces sannanensis TaxID=285536 RepID=UPI003CD06BA6